jgi:hypothetical protein
MNSYPEWLKHVAKFGLIAKGVVYFIFGSLIVMATYIPKDDPVGLFEIVKYTINLGWGGRLLTLLMAVGLFCYSLWKFFQMAYNVEGYEDNIRGYFIRITWLGPFLFYLVLGGHAFIQLGNWYLGIFSYNPNSTSALQQMLYSDWGKWVIGFIALTLIVNAGSLFYLAFTGRYTIMLTGRGFFQNSPALARFTGLCGYVGYGITLFLLGSLFAVALYFSNNAFAQGQDSLFYYLINQPYGRLILTVIAFGTVCYGVYFFLSSFYRWRDDGSVSSTNTGK